MSDVIATTAGVMKPVQPMNGKCYSLTELQHYVGGYIETVSLGNKVLVVDEEGKVKNKLPNKIATGWIITSGYNDYICGDAMLIDREHIQ